MDAIPRTEARPEARKASWSTGPYADQLSLVVAGANVHDTKLRVRPTLESIVVERPEGVHQNLRKRRLGQGV